MQIVDNAQPSRPEPSRVRIVASSRAWATWVLLGLNVAAFGWMLSRGGSATHIDAKLALELGANQYHAVRLEGEWWRLVVSTFLHGGVIHIALNMWGLKILGPFVEMYLGATGFLLLYLVSGIGASIVSIAWDPLMVSLGASGAIFALLGAHLAFFVRHRREMAPALFKSQLKSVAIMIGINVAYGLTIPQVDNAAHFGGLAFGVLGGFLLGRPLLEEPRMTPRRWFGVGALVILLPITLFVVAYSSAWVHASG